ncbi:hypothetical protein [Allopusillimonas ginsengisoli]|nr:hypothetical protein [Allopusillimonas ginsengisoli]
MRDYGKVHSSFWASKTVNMLSDEGKMLALYLLRGTRITHKGELR